MSEWKPIDTAPIDTNVEVGKWDGWGDRMEWKTTTGIPFTRVFFGLVRKRLYHGEYSHWRELPAPPKP